MRTVLLCAALAAAPAIAGDLVARQGSDSVRLAEGPCKVEQVLSQLAANLATPQEAQKFMTDARVALAKVR